MTHRKFVMKELEKVDGAEIMLQQTINGIESALSDVNVMEALK